MTALFIRKRRCGKEEEGWMEMKGRKMVFLEGGGGGRGGRRNNLFSLCKKKREKATHTRKRGGIDKEGGSKPPQTSGSDTRGQEELLFLPLASRGL